MVCQGEVGMGHPGRRWRTERRPSNTHVSEGVGKRLRGLLPRRRSRSRRVLRSARSGSCGPVVLRWLAHDRCRLSCILRHVRSTRIDPRHPCLQMDGEPFRKDLRAHELPRLVRARSPPAGSWSGTRDLAHGLLVAAASTRGCRATQCQYEHSRVPFGGRLVDVRPFDAACAWQRPKRTARRSDPCCSHNLGMELTWPLWAWTSLRVI
jgi:hypothetical protein